MYNKIAAWMRGGELRGTAATAELDAKRAAAAVACALEKLVARNDVVATSAAAAAEEGGGKSRGVAAFRGPRRPGISIVKYLERIHGYAQCSPACLVSGFVYVDRVVHRRPEFLVGSLDVHRLMLTGVMIASKYFDAMPQSNAFYAKVGGVSNAELNHLELELLFLLDFRVNVSSQEFESYLLHLEKELMASRPNPMITSSILDLDDGKIESHKANGSLHWSSLSPPQVRTP